MQSAPPIFLHTTDSLELIRNGRLLSLRPDVTLTDPPYTDHVQANLGFVTPEGKRGDVEAGFASLDGRDMSWVRQLVELTGRWSLFFCALEQLGDYKRASSDAWIRSGIYAKQRAMPQQSGDRPGNRCEGLAIFHRTDVKKRWNGRGSHAFWEAMPEHRKETMHPTAKPLMLCMRLVELFTDEGETVFDPFCGTGNIGIACALLGRRYVGLDQDASHVANASKRWEQRDEKKIWQRWEKYMESKRDEDPEE